MPPKKGQLQPRWKVDAHAGHAAKRSVPGTSQRKVNQVRVDVLRIQLRNTMQAAQERLNRLFADLGEKKSFNG